MAAKTREQANYIDWACYILLDISWPAELEEYWRIMIRSSQLRTCALADRDYKRIKDDLNLLLEKTDIEHNAPALLFAYMTTGFFAENLSLDVVIPNSFAALRLLNSYPVLREGFSENFFYDQMPDLIWTNIIHIEHREHLELFLNEFNQLDKVIREVLSTAPLAIEASSQMIDQCWLSESSKPKEEQNWSDVLSFLNQVGMLNLRSRK